MMNGYGTDVSIPIKLGYEPTGEPCIATCVHLFVSDWLGRAFFVQVLCAKTYNAIAQAIIGHIEDGLDDVEWLLASLKSLERLAGLQVSPASAAITSTASASSESGRQRAALEAEAFKQLKGIVRVRDSRPSSIRLHEENHRIAVYCNASFTLCRDRMH
eukprot:scaffold135186_cov21-Prasinocladus_malaysianus.AAC.1